MDITPNGHGAVVDVTDPARVIAVEAIADAIGRNEAHVLHLLRDLASERKALADAEARVERPGLDLVADDVLQGAQTRAETARDLVIGQLKDEHGSPVTVPVVMPGSVCRKAGLALVAAADAVAAHWRHNVTRFPQQDRKAS
ncbi:hypothetical protein BX265_5005 [Streptomyces sp. TLI_235]|nr:hypothetical protein [Streptomyces sp. TLI_235]PBC72219.1 hypothetical protein BX265_6841 [Streptomyces sp. TLI_235]PBC80168.1 hypothetical protein BX265_5005 [Streptomyces sp. TLI_235]